MLKVGLTGGIGAGKTTVSNLFQELGVPVIDTDVIARQVVYPGSRALASVVDAFGERILTQNGELNRKQLGRIVFSDPAERKKLETILHPAIRKETLRRIAALDAPYCIVVVPLLIETDFVRLVDKVLVVDASDESRIAWVKMRDGMSNTEVDNIIGAQTTRKRRLARADYVITNDGSLGELASQVADLHHRILADCGTQTDP